MDSRLNSLIRELDGIDLVLNKLESKTNVNVFEKLCANCERVFNSFCEFSAVELVSAGLGRKSIDFLDKLKSQVVRLKNYKEAITEYIKMTSGEEEVNLTAPSVGDIQAKAEELSSVQAVPSSVVGLEEVKNKQLTLNQEEQIAA